MTDQVFYEWDLENRLIAADTDGDGVNDVTYEYDADGIRVSQTVNSEETRFLLDKNRPYAQVLEEYTPGGILKVSYVHGHDLISQNRHGTDKSFYHVDGLGSTRALSDALGIVTDRLHLRCVWSDDWAGWVRRGMCICLRVSRGMRRLGWII